MQHQSIEKNKISKKAYPMISPYDDSCYENAKYCMNLMKINPMLTVVTKQ